MNSQDITRALIDTTVARAMVEMDADPKRSVRKLCDLGRQFSRGRFQNQIFAIFQDLLRNDESPYYQAIDFLLRSNDPEALRQFGINIGLAFQLQDDLLDVYGDTATFGKNIGGDILCNKKTFMLINALRLASNTQKAELNSWIGKKTFDPAEKIAAVTAIYDQLRLKELSEEKIHAYCGLVSQA